MSIIFITHDLGVISNIAQKVIVMYKGKIVEQGDINNIFRNPRHPYTKGLLACRPSVKLQQAMILPTINDFMKVSDDGTIEEIVNSKSATSDSKQETRNQKQANPILIVRNLKNYFLIGRSLLKKSSENYELRTTNYVRAVDNVSFEVYAGETLGLVGESGCGKTTLGRSILRLLMPSAGDVIYKGRNMASLSKLEIRKLRKEIQIIFQDPYSSLNPHISIGNAIMEPMKVHNILRNDRERKRKVIEILKHVNLKEVHFNRFPHEFSGGQRQRICIARALALNPQFIVCDESVSALDVSVQAQVLNLLNSLKKEFGFTYIFISHDLSVVRFMSDRIIVMKDGKIIEIGPADQIYSNPQSSYTQNLINSIPILSHIS
jgi:peptide/nickel transport system ATP-binding protein